MVTRVSPGLRFLLMPFLRPVWYRIWVRVERRVSAAEARFAITEGRVSSAEARLAAVENMVSSAAARLGATQALVSATEARFPAIEVQASEQRLRLATLDDAWRQHVPAFLNAVGTVDAFGHELVRVRDNVASQLSQLRDDAANQLNQLRDEVTGQFEQASIPVSAAKDDVTRLSSETNSKLDQTKVRLDNADASIGSLWERLEFIRREIMFEIAHGAGGAAASSAPAKLEPRVLNPEKIAAARAAGALQLNIGCGHITLPDHVNVDMRELPGVDVLAEAGDLPFEGGSVNTIASAHLLEHFPQETLRRRLLPHWFGLLREGGTFRAVTPDAAAMLAGAGAGTYSFEDFREVVFGAQDYAGDYHYNLLTPDSLRGLLEEAGFCDVAVPVAGRRNGKCFEFEITARRP